MIKFINKEIIILPINHSAMEIHVALIFLMLEAHNSFWAGI